MGNLSTENILKLSQLKNVLVKEGYKIEDLNDKREEKEEVIFTKDEEKALEETVDIWHISKKQAVMIYKTLGSVAKLRYANSIRKTQQEKNTSYKDLSIQMQKNKIFIDSVEDLENQRTHCMEMILSGDLTPTEVSRQRRYLEIAEELLEQRKPNLNRAEVNYQTLGAVIYYGQIVDRQYIAKEKEERFLPGMKKIRDNKDIVKKNKLVEVDK